MGSLFSGLWSTTKTLLGGTPDDHSAELAAAQEEANRQQAETDAANLKNQQALANSNLNNAVDLTTANAPNVEAAGTASDSTADATGVKKRRTAAGIASSLGLNNL